MDVTGGQCAGGGRQDGRTAGRRKDKATGRTGPCLAWARRPLVACTGRCRTWFADSRPHHRVCVIEGRGRYLHMCYDTGGSDPSQCRNTPCSAEAAAPRPLTCLLLSKCTWPWVLGEARRVESSSPKTFIHPPRAIHSGPTALGLGRPPLRRLPCAATPHPQTDRPRHDTETERKGIVTIHHTAPRD